MGWGSGRRGAKVGMALAWQACRLGGAPCELAVLA